ncbi:uncharacterized protein LOC129988496 [Argiope bruennichi]|uniref:uncharacterized protein LOC129988496 n=1 Tax=Argiope bruennichi TaxID=94029 RepID=UPI0024940528|nr:uncharacterized protein LOC129988496 [Argiope bruennichi]
MDCNSLPTLKNIAMMKVIALLCNVWERQLPMVYGGFVDFHLSQLSLPAPVEKELATTVRRTCSMLKKFYAIHQTSSTHLCYRCQCLKEILKSVQFWAFWTSDSPLVELNIVKGLIRYQRLSAVFRLILACEYSFEDDVPLLWKKLPVFVQSNFFRLDMPIQVIRSTNVIMYQELWKFCDDLEDITQILEKHQ